MSSRHKGAAASCAPSERARERESVLSGGPRARSLSLCDFSVAPLSACLPAIRTSALVICASRFSHSRAQVMAVNNEIGTLQPLREIGEIAKAAGALFHTDAAQMIGKLPFDVNEIGCDLVSISGHKLYGPLSPRALNRSLFKKASTKWFYRERELASSRA